MITPLTMATSLLARCPPSLAPDQRRQCPGACWKGISLGSTHAEPGWAQKAVFTSPVGASRQPQPLLLTEHFHQVGSQEEPHDFSKANQWTRSGLSPRSFSPNSHPAGASSPEGIGGYKDRPGALLFRRFLSLIPTSLQAMWKVKNGWNETYAI